MLPKLQDALRPSAARRRAGFLFGADRLRSRKRRGRVWVRIRMKRAKATDPNQLLNEKEDPHDRQIIAELKPQPQDIVFQKRRPDGFVGTDLDLMLRSNGIKTILIGGVATEGGVEGTARSARNLGYDVVVLKDCVGSRNRELHEMALKLMEQTFFDVASAADISAIWSESMTAARKIFLLVFLTCCAGLCALPVGAADDKTLVARQEGRPGQLLHDHGRG